jgi:hypothetical protein
MKMISNTRVDSVIAKAFKQKNSNLADVVIRVVRKNFLEEKRSKM